MTSAKQIIAEFQDFSRQTSCCNAKENEIMNWAIRLWAELAMLDSAYDYTANNTMGSDPTDPKRI